ncbi:interleukin-13 receptor subunit alpha-2-like isoform X2 [Carcharodon carcharias]|uniref:interleukin-13 receptor subunit alpha-2-like isoform X2 n=1 Tax=Carcharodon carcharias TaxID=13397 RepID=UPI001B7E3AA7|nr:interleukin-13 receptor subunit alpha-2-like isoform X2 [Carcharodon carcharias]
MFQLAHCIAISFVLTTALSDGNLEFLANLTELNPPTNITVINRELGELTFAWNDNLSEDMKRRIDVRYLFEYKYFDSHDWEHCRIQHTENEDTFELHRGVSVRVKNVLLDRKQVTVKESNWTVEEIEPSGDPETLISNFSCIVYNHSSMNCTWRKGRKAPTDTQYTMYYSQNKNTRQCTQYFMDVCGMQGCHVDHIDIEEILICVKGSSNSRTIRPYYTKIDPTSCVTYSPPVNLKVLQNLTVKWDMPPDEDYYNDFFEFELNVSGLDVPLITVDEPNYVFVNINPTKRYSVKVRMRSKYCKKAKIWNNWSNWSNEDFIGAKCWKLYSNQSPILERSSKHCLRNTTVISRIGSTIRYQSQKLTSAIQLSLKKVPRLKHE